MALNDAALSLIETYEGWVPRWYPDPAAGWDVPTCCFGHTDMAGDPKYADAKDKTFSRVEGRAILRRDLSEAERTIARYVTVPLNENERGALASFTHNLGSGNFQRSTLLERLNAGDRQGAADEFPRWNRAGGQVMRGLTRRRNAERSLFLTPTEAPTPKPRPDTDPTPTKKRSGGTAAIVVAVLAALGAALGKLFGII